MGFSVFDSNFLFSFLAEHDTQAPVEDDSKEYEESDGSQ